MKYLVILLLIIFGCSGRDFSVNGVDISNDFVEFRVYPGSTDYECPLAGSIRFSAYRYVLAGEASNSDNIVFEITVPYYCRVASIWVPGGESDVIVQEYSQEFNDIEQIRLSSKHSSGNLIIYYTRKE